MTTITTMTTTKTTTTRGAPRLGERDLPRCTTSQRPSARGSSTDDDDDDDDVGAAERLPECLEESCFIAGGDNDDAEGATATQLTKEETLKSAIRDVLSRDKKLHQSVLYFRPVDFEDFHGQVRGSGIRCNKQFTMNWLDDMGIQFTMKNTKQGEKRKEKAVKRQERFKKRKKIGAVNN